jgi:hypothetical protein
MELPQLRDMIGCELTTDGEMGLFSRRQVPFEVTICGIDELGLHCDRGVTHALSILDPGWPEPSGGMSNYS